jgi:hypothetical protein
MARTETAEIRLRKRNQLTIPDAMVRAAGFEPGARFVVELDPAEPDTMVIRRLRTSYAGALRGLWREDADTYLEAERNVWD